MAALFQRLKDLIYWKYVFFWLIIIVIFVLYSKTVKSNDFSVALLVSVINAFSFVGSLYVWKNPENRDHPTTIKRRILGVGFVIIISIIMLYNTNLAESYKGNFLAMIGVRSEGSLFAVLLPLLLTMMLYLGPIVLHILDGVFYLYIESQYWKSNLTNLVWLRNHLAAPLFEELIFRAFMLPGLSLCLGNTAAILICPLFFGISHVHHIREMRAGGVPLDVALKAAAFQSLYTSVFGAYSAFLFLRTGHVIAPFIAHAFCNHMGLPDIEELMGYQQPTRGLLWGVFVVGMVLFALFLFPLTTPSVYL